MENSAEDSMLPILFNILTNWNSLEAVLRFSKKFRGKSRVFQIVSYQLNYIYKGPHTHGGVCLDHLESFRISFKTFENIPRNVLREIT